ncbi:MAG: hypothetical protein QOG13_1495 [Sphingomonadales bacterium]|jgi:hypothetical protein|nr:hypothetical protein [Sphingomonadales bacterium]
MNEARPFASLSSGLLARKGAARPAMRPQGYNGGSFEDLGWNDMGGQEPEEDVPEHVPSSIAALTPAPRHPQADDAPEPEVVAQQRQIAEAFEAEELSEPAPVEEAPAPAPAPVHASETVALPRPAAAAGYGRKAAFTLRVDAERHLRLRLATAVTGRSAQQIVTEALDHLLASLPEIEALAERVPASGGKRK